MNIEEFKQRAAAGGAASVYRNTHGWNVFTAIVEL